VNPLKIGSPVSSHRNDGAESMPLNDGSLFPTPAMLVLHVGSIALPVWKIVTPEASHPPSASLRIGTFGVGFGIA
jgi:hypothetical protein